MLVRVALEGHNSEEDTWANMTGSGRTLWDGSHKIEALGLSRLYSWSKSERESDGLGSSAAPVAQRARKAIHQTNEP